MQLGPRPLSKLALIEAFGTRVELSGQELRLLARREMSVFVDLPNVDEVPVG
jgi:hypothetical protein